MNHTKLELDDNTETKHVNEMKIQTMYKMVEPIKIKSGLAKKSDKRFLYFTNKQVSLTFLKCLKRTNSK